MSCNPSKPPSVASAILFILEDEELRDIQATKQEGTELRPQVRLSPIPWSLYQGLTALVKMRVSPAPSAMSVPWSLIAPQLSSCRNLTPSMLQGPPNRSQAHAYSHPGHPPPSARVTISLVRSLLCWNPFNTAHYTQNKGPNPHMPKGPAWPALSNPLGSPAPAQAFCSPNMGIHFLLPVTGPLHMSFHLPAGSFHHNTFPLSLVLA